MDYPKDFDGWIQKKKDCHFRPAVPPMFKERDIWWVSVLISQLRVFSAKRIEDKLAEIDTKDFNKVKEEVVKMISFSLPPKRKSRG